MSTRETGTTAEATPRRSGSSTPPATAEEKLQHLAANPFVVLGEARLVGDDIVLTILGDLPPEPRLGMAPQSFPPTIRAAQAMMHPDDWSAFANQVTRSVATGESFEMNYRLADGRGGWRWIDGRAVCVEVHDGRHVGWVFSNRDATKQKEAELSLQTALRELEVSQSTAQSEHDRLWKLAANAFSLHGEAHLTESGMDMDFFGDGPYEAKVGLAPGTVPTTMAQIQAMMHPADLKPFQQTLEHSIGTGEPFRVIYRLADGRGGWRWLQVQAISLEAHDGRHIRWLHNTIDITERKEAEEALRVSLEELRQLKAQLQNENVFLREQVHRGAGHIEIVGHSAGLARVLEQIKLVAATSSTVLISGETGTGKELVARAIHDRSERRKGLFVAVNCAALPSSLVESELFGHEKGAFTGAVVRRIGRFEQADGGTLFLDEAGELPLETQAKMLRVLQSGEFERVGGARPLRTNVRVIAASNRDLEQAVRDGRFRSDLYHRLSVFPIHLPPLRERREDIALLAAYLITRKARQLGRQIDRIPEVILERLAAYDWPGNVRELENVIERAIILSPGTSLRPEAILLGTAAAPRARATRARSEAADESAAGETLEARERVHILRTCESTAWKIKGPDGAAQRLGINPGTLYSRMKKLGITRPG